MYSVHYILSFRSASKSSHPQISEKHDGPLSAITAAAEDNKLVTEEQPKPSDPETQQDTDEHHTKAEEKDTDQQVMTVTVKVCVFQVVVVIYNAIASVVRF